MTGTKAALLALILGAFTCSILPLSRASAAETNRLFKYYHVYIINELPVDGKDVKVHCWSSENDIGVKTLALNEAYFFQFQLNIKKSTRFECMASKGDVNTTFTGFKATRDEGERCDFHCWWALREQGIFFSHDKSTWKFEYAW